MPNFVEPEVRRDAFPRSSQHPVPGNCCWVWVFIWNSQNAHLYGGVGCPNGNGHEEMFGGSKINVPLLPLHRHTSEVQLWQKEMQSLSHKALAPSAMTTQILCKLRAIHSQPDIGNTRTVSKGKELKRFLNCWLFSGRLAGCITYGTFLFLMSGTNREPKGFRSSQLNFRWLTESC